MNYKEQFDKLTNEEKILINTFYSICPSRSFLKLAKERKKIQEKFFEIKRKEK
jgi:hypothetical protein